MTATKPAAAKPRKATKAPKPAAAIAAPAAKPAAAPAAKKAAPAASGDTATIRFEKDKVGRRGVIRGAVNGQKFEFPVGKDIPVTKAQLEVLERSAETFTTVTPLAGEGAAEGSAASSTLTGTAFRDTAGPGPNPGIAEDGTDQTPVLNQRTDEELARDSQEASKQQAQANEGSAGDGGDTGTKPTGEMKPAE